MSPSRFTDSTVEDAALAAETCFRVTCGTRMLNNK